MKIKKNNMVIYGLAILVGIISMFYYVALKISFGSVAFSSIFFIIGLILFAYGMIEIIFKINIWGKVPKKFRKLITILFIVGLSFFIIIEGIIIYEGKNIEKGNSDYLIVLGAGLRGEQISMSLKYRLDTAIEFNKENPNVKIIVSGGKGPGENITEALAMKKYLVSNGVREDLIIEEDKSTSTYENFLFTKELLKKEFGDEDYTLTVITNGFHMHRAKYLGEKLGFETLGYPAPTHQSTALNYYFREFFAVVKAYIFNN